jgi:hypothetical protein
MPPSVIGGPHTNGDSYMVTTISLRASQAALRSAWDTATAPLILEGGARDWSRPGTSPAGIQAMSPASFTRLS